MPLRGHLSPPSLPLIIHLLLTSLESVFSFQVLIPDLCIVHLSFHTNYIWAHCFGSPNQSSHPQWSFQNTFQAHCLLCISDFLWLLTRQKSKSFFLVCKTLPHQATPHHGSHCSDLATSADSFPQSGCSSPNTVPSTFLNCLSCWPSSCHVFLQSLHWSRSFIL